MMNLFDRILNTEEILQKPPVLVDIGASGKLHETWKKLSKHSICLAFDADEREFGFVREETENFKRLLIYNCIVTAAEMSDTDFYLTKSPYCSSILEPDAASLKDWAFSELFEVQKKVKMRTRSLVSVLKEAKLEYIDWFKTDSQGTDLRLFASLPDEIRKKILVAEFEPGIIDAYHGEDKLFRLIEYMNNKHFFMSDIIIKGTQRISAESLRKIFKSERLRKLIQVSLKNSPGWAEVTYMNSFKDKLEKREYLLGWIFATIKKQHGIAFTLADEGYMKFGDQIFLEMKDQSDKSIMLGIFKLKFIPALFKRIKELII